jgi:hypothetical protein
MNVMTKRHLALAGITAAVVAAGLPGVVPGSAVEAQQVQPRPELPLAPVTPRGNFVAPYFDGFIRHEDGSRTFSFAYLNRNQSETIHIPIGPDNYLEPEEFNGHQPTHFYVVNYGGFGGPRERGAFAVHVPADYQGDVVWHLRSPGGQEASVPGRSITPAYELSVTPQAAGSLRPYVRFSPDGEPGFGPMGVFHEEEFTTAVGEPITLAVWGEDRGERDPTALNMTWQIHQGPAGSTAEFDPRTLRFDTEGEAANQGVTQVTFDTPGEYVLRVRIDNFTVGDSSFGNMCCWSNGYVRVNVTD